MARVDLTDDAKDDLRSLDRSVANRVLKDLEKLKTSPASRGDRLGSRNTGDLTGLRRRCIGPKKGDRAGLVASGNTIAVVVVIATRSESEGYELALARIRLVTAGDLSTAMASLLASILGR